MLKAKRVALTVLVFFAALLLSNSVMAATTVSGEISGNTEWTAAAGPYFVSSSVTVNSGVTLTVQPGTVVKFAQGQGLFVNGTLNAVGAAGNEITFTDYRDDTAGGDSNGNGNATAPAPGWWRGIVVSNLGAATITNCEVRYAGSLNANVYKTGAGTLSLANSSIRDSANYGIYLDGATTAATVTGNTISGNVQYGIYASGNSPATISGNTLSRNGRFGVYASVTNPSTFTVSNNSFNNNGMAPIGVTAASSGIAVSTNNSFTGKNYVHIEGGSVSSSQTWGNGGAFVYYVADDISISASQTLTVQPGTVVKFAQGRALYFTGNLNATGTSGNRIYFTDFRDDTGGDSNGDGTATAAAPGWWRGIELNNFAAATLDYCVVRYASSSAGQQALLYKGGAGDLSISNSSFTYGTYRGISLVNASGTVSVTTSTISSIAAYGFYLSGSATAPTITKSQISGSAIGIYCDASANPVIGGSDANANDIFDNSTFSVQNTAPSSINATHNWWGSNGGPLLSGYNKVSANVDYSSFLTASVFENSASTPGAPVTIVVGATISSSVSWPLSGSPYYVSGNLSVAAGGTLTIASGAVVKFANRVGFDISGTLSATGVTFTDFRDDSGGDSNGDGTASSPAPGWWRGILVHDGGSAIITDSLIRYGGSDGPNYSNLYKTGASGSLQVSGSTISMSSNYGIYLNAAAVATTITGSTFSNNGADGILAGGSSPATISGGNSFIGNSRYGIYASVSNPAAFAVSANIFTFNGSAPIGVTSESSGIALAADNSGLSHVLVEGGNISATSHTWGNATSPISYYVSGNVTVSAGPVLTIRSGTVVKFANRVGFDINGTLNASGVTFTDFRDDSGGDSNGDGTASSPAPGWWRGILVHAGGSATITSCVVRYGGSDGPNSSNLYKTGATGSLELSGSTISHSSGYGIYLNAAAVATTITGGTFSNNGADGILAGGNSPATVSTNSFIGNGRYGIYASVSALETFTVSGNSFTYNATAPIGVTSESSGITLAADNSGLSHVLVEGGNISASNHTWGNATSPITYYVSGNVSVTASPVLTIRSGTVVKFANRIGFDISGRLNASGVTFTDYRDDTVGGDTNANGSATSPAPGWWRGILVHDGGSATITDSVVRYGGSDGPNYSNIYKTGATGSLQVNGTIVSHSSGYGLYLNGAVVSSAIASSTFSNNGADGILASGNSPATVTGNSFTGNGRYGIYANSSASSAFSIQNNIFTANVSTPIRMTAVGSGAEVTDDNSFSGPLVVEGGSIGSSMTWLNNRVYYASGVITVPAGATLTVPAGRVVKFAQNTHYAIYGHLQAVGSSGSRIVFTDFRDDADGGDSNADGTGTAPAPNWWYGVLVYEGGSSSIDYATVRYAGLSGYGGIWKTGSGDLSVSNSILEKSSTHGLQLLNSSGNHSISFNTVRDNGSHGILIQTGGATAAVSNNTVTGSGAGNGGVHGIYLNNTPAAISSNTVSGSGGYGLYVTGATLPVSVTSNILNGNGIGGVGMAADSSGAVIADNNTFDGPLHVEVGSITRNTDWVNNRVYYARGVVTVNAGATLTVPAGRVVKFAQNTHYAIYGHLQAVGNSGSRIVFTDFRDDEGGDSDGVSATPSPNWWYGVLIYDGGSSTIDYATVRYAGLSGYGGIWKTGSGNLSLSNTILEKNSTFGLQLLNSGGNHSISFNTVRDNGSHGILIQTGGTTVAVSSNTVTGNGVGNGGAHGIYLSNTPAAISSNTVSGSGGYGLYVTGASLPVSVTSNILNGNGIGGVGMSADSSGAVIADNNTFDGPLHVEGGSITRNTDWVNNRVYYARGVVTVNAGATLTVPAGRVVKFAQNTHYSIYGNLQAVGSSGSRIVFTDFRDDEGGDSDGVSATPSPNWWYGVLIHNGGSSTFDFATVRYAGLGSYGNIWKTGSGNLSVSNSILEKSSTFGLRFNGSSGNHTVSNTVVRDNASHGIHVQSSSGAIAVSATTSRMNGAYGMAVENSSASISISSGIFEYNAGGIYAGESSPLIQGNIIRHNGAYGMYASGSSTQAALYKNTIFSHGVGVYCTASANPVIGGSAANSNNIVNNTSYGVQNTTSSNQVNATYNWWGSATGPHHAALNPLGTGNAVSDFVDFVPYLATPDVPIAIELVSPALKAFGHVTTGATSVAQVFTITNSGVQNLDFSSISLTGTNADQFRITQNLCQGQSLATAASCTITAVFEPTVSRPAQALLTIVSNDIYTPTLSLPLTGTGSIVLPFRDDFSGSPVSTNWFVMNEDQASYNLTENPGYLRLYTTPTNFSGLTNNATNLFIVSLPSGVDQFVATAKLQFPAPSFSTPNQNFQQGGVTFMSDKNGAPDLDNFVRAQYAFDAGRRFETAYDINGSPGAYQGGTIDSITSSTPVWIRIIRKATEYTAEYSLNGSSYTLITSMTGPWDISYVGLHALNGDQSLVPSIPVDVDYFQVYELPSISVTPSSATFGSLSVGQSSAPSPFVISNAGPGPLTITSIARNGSDPDMFTVDNGTCGSLPATIAPNQSCSFSVTFTPTTDGLKTANISIASNDIETPVTNLQLSGTTSYVLSLNLGGTGNGAVNSNANFSCTTSEKNCSGRFDYGTIVYLYAVSDINSTFAGWTGDCSGSNCSVSMTTNKSVTGTFTIRTFTITATAGAHGVITSPGITTHQYGSSASFTLTPDAGYHISSVLIDGDARYVANSQAANTYTFDNIITNHTIAVTFAADTTPQIRIQRDSSGYQTVQDAYNNAVSGDVIQLVNQTHVGPAFFALRDIDVTLKGGYELIADENGGYSFTETSVGNAALPGPVTLGAGSLVMDSVTVR